MAASYGLGSSFTSTLSDALQGSSTAFEAIFTTYAGRIRAFAMARGAGDPDGLTNDVMLRVFQNLSSFSGEEDAFVRWIFTIARNRLIDLHRSAQRRPLIADAEVPERSASSAESVALDRLGVEATLDLLAALTIEQREVIALRMIHDLSIADVAKIVDRPVSAVKALQRRGLRRLQRQIFGEVVS